MQQVRSASEADVVATIRDFLALCGAWHVKSLGTLGARRGVPDILACVPWRRPDGTVVGRFVAIEVKRPGLPDQPAGRVSEAQRRELKAIAGAGGLAIVARSLDDVLAAFDAVGLIPPFVAWLSPERREQP